MNRKYSAHRFLKYASAGFLGTSVQYAALLFLVSGNSVDPTRASVIGALLGAIVNYFLNVRFTFRATDTNHLTVFPRFALTAFVGLICTAVIMSVGTKYIGINYLIAQLVATGVSLGLTFTINSVWSFRNERLI